jgi:hypothetical protein
MFKHLTKEMDLKTHFKNILDPAKFQHFISQVFVSVNGDKKVLASNLLPSYSPGAVIQLDKNNGMQ